MKKRALLDRGYGWLCYCDQSGIFLNRVFRQQDIEVKRGKPPEEEELWAEGLVFVHLKKGIRARVEYGQLVPLSTSHSGD